jgi:hypothetical protein
MSAAETWFGGVADFTTLLTSSFFNPPLPPVLLFLTAFEDGVLIDYVFFGLHLFFLGYLVFKSGYLPRILGVLLILGSFGYLTNSSTSILFPSYEAIVSQFLPPFQIMELVLFLWLLIKGANVEQWEERALESA